MEQICFDKNYFNTYLFILTIILIYLGYYYFTHINNDNLTKDNVKKETDNVSKDNLILELKFLSIQLQFHKIVFF